MIEHHHISLLDIMGNMQAEADARQANKLAPAWPKPLHRLAQALQVTHCLPAPTTLCRPSYDKVSGHFGSRRMHELRPIHRTCP